jgi:hypothetical protein
MRDSQNKYEDVQLMQGFLGQQWNFPLSRQTHTKKEGNIKTPCCSFD